MIIKKLPKEVINKIAAGEVIQRPYNVVKELVENSIDADSTQIRVNIRDGGLGLIEITDNGKGIRKADFPLLCQRFATSKISDLSDLENIVSFGFRGEALASLSYVSDLQVTSKHKDENLGYRCTFKDERMMDEAEALSMNTGTKIKAAQLFGNLQTRRSALNGLQEKKRVVRLLSHFALHYYSIKFSLQSEKGSELSTDFRSSKVSQAKMKVFQTITKLPYDKFTYLPKQALEQVRAEAIITKLNTIKGKALLLNVNNRIVENPDLTKAVQRAYSECYQSIHQDNQTFFVYLSLDLDPKRIDCNQHPSKKTIGFFAADRIYQAVYNWVLQHIKQQSSIKNIATNIPTKGKLSFNLNKNMLMSIKGQSQPLPDNDDVRVQRQQLQLRREEPKTQKPVYAYQKNRTDALQMPITFYTKSRVEVGDSSRWLSFILKPDQTRERGDLVKKFFQEVSYVGCFNLNYIFVHISDRLYLMNLLPFTQSFVREWLSNPNNKLLIHDIYDDFAKIDLRNSISRFIKEQKLQRKIDLNTVIQSILINKDIIFKEYGITVQQSKDGKNGRITSFPLFDRFMADCLLEDELSYFLCRTFGRSPTEVEREGYFVQLLVSLFQQRQGGNQVKMEEQTSKGQLSPMNDKYSQFIRDKMIPLLKTKGKDYKEINFGQYLTEMMNLKDIYKIFQRC